MNLKSVSGLNTVLQAFSKATKDKIAPSLERGLKKAGLYLQGKSQAIVPVQLGVLKNSAGTKNAGGHGYDADIVVYYNTEYAVFVHEDLTKAHGKAFNAKHADAIAAAAGTSRGTAKGGVFNRGEDQQAKFLEQPARECRNEILKIIKTEVARL